MNQQGKLGKLSKKCPDVTNSRDHPSLLFFDQYSEKIAPNFHAGGLLKLDDDIE